MTAPSVCVAIPVKNGAAWLPEAIESVLGQTDGELDLSVHVVDNISDDDSVAIARGYADSDPRVTVDVNPVDVKYYGSLNRILAEATAAYFVPFAADDVMAAGNLARKVEALEQTGAGFAHSTGQLVDELGAFLEVWPDHRATPALLRAPEFFERLVPKNEVSCQSVVARTAALRDIGGFDGRSFYAADWLAWLRLSLRWPVATLAETLIANRVHARAGTATSSAAGHNGRDVPATLDLVFRDDRMPPTWHARRDALVAASEADVAFQLQRAGLHRLSQGWAAYMLMGRAWARQPHDTGLRGAYEGLVRTAGLVPPSSPIEAVTIAPATAREAGLLDATVRRLGGLLERLLIAVDPVAVDRAMALLEPLFGDRDLDGVLVPTEAPEELLVHGRLTLAMWESDLVAASEAAGVPVFPFGVPDPFAGPPDPARWETVDASRCIV